MRTQLKRGVPPLFVTLKPLYKDPDKVARIESVAESFVENLERSSKFSDSGTRAVLCQRRSELVASYFPMRSVQDYRSEATQRDKLSFILPWQH